jgi:hypothetical protein
MLRNLFGIAAMLPLVIACAPVARAQDYGISPQQRALVDRTCRDVLGLKRGEAWFAGCQESLSDTLTAGDEARAVTADTQTQIRLSFYEVPPLVRWQRERLACARLGLPPGSSPFGACVTSLQGAFLPALN